jgi:hypothetical protein
LGQIRTTEEHAMEHTGSPEEPGYQYDCPACEAMPEVRTTVQLDGVTEIRFRTAAIVIHHDAGIVETFAHDDVTTDADWQRVCAELSRPGARLGDDYSQDEQGWMITTGTF